MSIQTAIQNAQQKVANAYTAVSEKGGTLPATKNLSNLPAAIGSISGGGGSSIGITREVPASGLFQGMFQMPATSFTFSLPSNATDIGSYAMYRAFAGCSELTSIDLSGLTTLSGDNAMNYAFYGCSELTSVDLSSLTTVSGESAMYGAFSECTGLTSVDLSSLTTVSGSQAMTYAFSWCTGLTTLSFPALTSTSLSSDANQFDDMLFEVTGCTVHFPSNLQSVIGSWSSVELGFSGADTTVLFDLPATS